MADSLIYLIIESPAWWWHCYCRQPIGIFIPNPNLHFFVAFKHVNHLDLGFKMSFVAEFHAVCNKQGYPQAFWGQVLLCQTFLLGGTAVPISKLALYKDTKSERQILKGFYIQLVSMSCLGLIPSRCAGCFMCEAPQMPALPLFETCRCALFEISSWIGKSAVQVQRLWIGLYPIITCWAAQLAEVTSFNLDNPIQILPVENILGFQAVLGT